MEWGVLFTLTMGGLEPPIHLLDGRVEPGHGEGWWESQFDSSRV